jgi:putative transposase
VAILDWFTRSIVSRELSQNMGEGSVMEAARAARAKATPTIWNLDQESKFTSPQYTSLLTEADEQISLDGRGRFVDNIFTKWLGRTIKY